MNPLVRGPFDADFYLETYPDVRASGMDPREHYLNFGQAEGRMANASEMYGSEPVPFDADFYLATNPDVASAGVDPYEHYVQFGRLEGRLPTPPEPISAQPFADDHVVAGYPDFDADFYFEAFPDIAASGMPALSHYLQYGRYEQRVTHAVDVSEQWREGAIDPARDTIVVVSHDASRTGAPILAWNVCRQLAERFNVVSILLADGPLLDIFRETCAQTIVLPSPEMRHPLVLERLVRDIAKRLNVRGVLVNSIESRMIVEPLAKHGYRVVLLIHEYASYTHSPASIDTAVNHASTVVFSAQSVRDDLLDSLTRDSLPSSIVLRQGKSLIPASLVTTSVSVPDEVQASTAAPIDTYDEVEALLRGLSPRPRLVLGAGTVQFRKGVDLFFATAAELARQRPGDNTLFVWVGDDPDTDLSYTACLNAQLRASRRTGGHVRLMKSTDQFEKLYALADVFYLSSRLDPLPNVAIDAMTAGLPVVCFEDTGGIPEMLQDSAFADASVVPFSNTVQASEKIAALLDNEDLSTQIGQKNQRIAEQRFNMDKYVARLIDLL